MPKIKLAENTIQLIKDICAEFENKESELINVLHKVQSKLGYLPAEVQEVIANEFQLAIAANNIGFIYRNLGNLENSMKYFYI